MTSPSEPCCERCLFRNDCEVKMCIPKKCQGCAGREGCTNNCTDYEPRIECKGQEVMFDD